jgi:putative transcriptional regulator
MKSSHSGRVASAILEMADDLHRVGIMAEPPHEKITLRHLGRGALVPAEPISGEEIRVPRERRSARRATPRERRRYEKENN